MTLFIGILEEGLIYAIMALGVYITYKILDFPDLSVDSTFPMGAALTASAILAGINPVLTLFLAFGAGALAGCVTGLIHVKLKVRDLLSGIIVMTGLYSLNLRMAGGRANVPIFSQETIFENGFLGVGGSTESDPIHGGSHFSGDHPGVQGASGSVSENQIRLPVTGCW